MNDPIVVHPKFGQTRFLTIGKGYATTRRRVVDVKLDLSKILLVHAEAGTKSSLCILEELALNEPKKKKIQSN